MAWTYVEPAHFKKDYFPDVLGPKGSCEKDKVQYTAPSTAPPPARRQSLPRTRTAPDASDGATCDGAARDGAASSAGAASEGPFGSRRARGAGRAKSERDAGGDGVAAVVDSPSVHLIRHRP